MACPCQPDSLFHNKSFHAVRGCHIHITLKALIAQFVEEHMRFVDLNEMQQILGARPVTAVAYNKKQLTVRDQQHVVEIAADKPWPDELKRFLIPDIDPEVAQDEVKQRMREDPQ